MAKDSGGGGKSIAKKKMLSSLVKVAPAPKVAQPGASKVLPVLRPQAAARPSSDFGGAWKYLMQALAKPIPTAPNPSVDNLVNVFRKIPGMTTAYNAVATPAIGNAISQLKAPPYSPF